MNDKQWELVGWQRKWKPECVPKRGGYMERDWGDIPEDLYMREPERFDYRQLFTPRDGQPRAFTPKSALALVGLKELSND